MLNNITVMYVITSNCNLKCYGCIQNCDKFQSEYYIDVETFKKEIKILHQTLPHLTHLVLQGGEPLLHKELVTLCKIAHKELPEVKIDIYTNSILLNTLKDDDLIDLYENYNVNFYLSLYPIHIYLNTYKKQIERLEKLGIKLKWQNSHIIFNKFNFCQNKDTDKIKKSFKSCVKHMITNTSFILKQGYLYLCCPSIAVVEEQILDPTANFGRIKLDKLKNESQLLDLLNQPFDVCQYCAMTQFEQEQQIIPWKPQNLIDFEINNYIPFSNLYTNHYEAYEKLANNFYDLHIFMQEPVFFEHIKNDTGVREFDIILNKFFTGFLDIFIPFSNDNFKKIDIKNFKNQLLKQKNIEKFNLYFISIDNDKELQQKLFKEFAPFSTPKLNTYFFKNKGLYSSYITFIKNSYIKNKYLFDIQKDNLISNEFFIDKIIKKEGEKNQ